MPRARISVELTVRELAALVSALNYARDQSVNPSWHWWEETAYVRELRECLVQALEIAQAGEAVGS